MDLELLEEKLDSISQNVKWLGLFARDTPKNWETFEYIEETKDYILNTIKEIHDMAN